MIKRFSRDNVSAMLGSLMPNRPSASDSTLGTISTRLVRETVDAARESRRWVRLVVGGYSSSTTSTEHNGADDRCRTSNNVGTEAAISWR